VSVSLPIYLSKFSFVKTRFVFELFRHRDHGARDQDPVQQHVLQHPQEHLLSKRLQVSEMIQIFGLLKQNLLPYKHSFEAHLHV
jgi:hypothetical protein